MIAWRWLSSLYPLGRRRSVVSRKRLQTAYDSVFGRNDGAEDIEIVLADLANFSGFYKVMDYGVSGEDRAHADGRRAVFARIHKFLRLTPNERTGLEIAARDEARTDSQEGEF